SVATTAVVFRRLTTVRHPKGLHHHSSTPQGAAVVAVPSSDRHHDGGLAADNPYSTTNQINQPPDLSISFYNRSAGKAAAVAAVVVAVALVVSLVYSGVIGADGDGGWWRCMATVSGGAWHGGAGGRGVSGVVNRIDRETGSVFVFAGKVRRRTFPAATPDGRWPEVVVAGRRPAGGEGERKGIRSKQPFILEESPVDMMADQRTMAELLRAPTEGYAEAIVVPRFLLSNSSSSTGQPIGGLKKNPRVLFSLGKILSQNSSMNSFPLKNNESPYKDLLRACPHHGFTEFHQLDTFYNALNPIDQDSLNSAAGGNLLERRTQDVLMIIENKSKVRNSRNKSVVSQVNSSDANSNSSSEIAKLTHALNQQTSAMTTAIIAILKQFQETLPLAFVKDVEEICVTCGGAHPYYQCLVAGGNTFPILRDNIQGYTAAAAVNYNKGNSVIVLRGRDLSLATPLLTPNGELKAITTQSGIVLDGPSVPISPLFINPEEDEHIEETLTDQDLAEDPLHPNIPYSSRMLKQKQQEKDEVQIHKIWQMFKQLHINITLADALILIPKYQKMLKALLSNKEKLLELANTPFNENCSDVILKKLPEKLGDPGKFLIPCGFNKLNCKALTDLGASINLMPLSVWKKLGLPELISTRMTLELANRAICTPAGISRDVFVSVGKFTFPADFVIVDYESDPRVPLILGRPFLWTACALIDVHREEMILYDGDERLTLNMRHDTSSYSNQPQKESINLINVFNDSKVKDDILDPEGGNVLPEKLLDLDSTKDLHPPNHVNPLSGSTTSSSSLNQLLEEFVDELSLLTFSPGNDDLLFNIESNLKEIEYLLHHDPIKDIYSILKDSIDQSNLDDLNNNLVDSMPEMFTNEDSLDYSSPPLYDEYDDDLSNLRFSEDYALTSANNENMVFNPGILIQENLFEIITRVAPEKKLAISHASLMLKDFDPPLYELPFFKEVPRSKILLSFSSENKEKVFKPRIHTSKKVHSSLIPKLSHQGYKVFKINLILNSPINIFLFSCGKDIHILDVPCLHFYPP
nr:reverse transcriptase domain-containing protein [Tanacetum cinerariifolium]